jgi:hypothetical protein
MTDEEEDKEEKTRIRAFFDKWEQEVFAGMTPFQRYLHDSGQFEDVSRKEISADDVFTEPVDLCGDDLDWEECGGYRKRDGEVTFCTNPRHQQSSEREVPFDHCSYVGCENCPEIVTQGIVISHCTCAHHRSVH